MTLRTERFLNGRTALVTGGARGLGAALCGALADAGAAVVVADLRADAGERVTRALTERGCTASFRRLDVGDAAQVADCVASVLDRYAALDILINNAGVDHTLSIDELSIAQWDQVIATNLRGPFLLSREAARHMKTRASGHIINITSTAAKRAWPNASAYHASKWGLLGFSHALHVEARPHGVKTTAVVAGGMRTPFLLDRFPDIDVDTLQDPRNVADTIRFILTQPAETVIPEVMVIPMTETSWP
jgi:NAD(P)-dependent dehydrogenase (short-subunit alcohol dehydrogenase family)